MSVTPSVHADRVQSSVMNFGAVARALSFEARRHGLRTPAFRSPPRRPGVARAITRWPDGGAVVVVRVRGRPLAEVVADMIEGVLVANRTGLPQAQTVRRALWQAVSEEVGDELRHGRSAA